MSVSEKHIGKVMKAGLSQKEIEYLTQTIKQRRCELLTLSYQVCSRFCGLHPAENHRGL